MLIETDQAMWVLTRHIPGIEDGQIEWKGCRDHDEEEGDEGRAERLDNLCEYSSASVCATLFNDT